MSQRETLCKSITFTVINKYAKGAVVEIETVIENRLKSACLPYCLWRGSLKQDFLDIYLTTYFGVRHFRSTETMRVIFFWECSNFNVELKNLKSNSEKWFCFWDKCIWIRCIKLPVLRKEYLSFSVNVLTNSLKISYLTKSDYFQLNYLHSDQWIWQKCCCWDWSSVLARLPRCLLRSPLKWDFSAFL